MYVLSRPYLDKQGIAYVAFKYLILENYFKQVAIILRKHGQADIWWK